MRLVCSCKHHTEYVNWWRCRFVFVLPLLCISPCLNMQMTDILSRSGWLDADIIGCLESIHIWLIILFKLFRFIVECTYIYIYRTLEHYIGNVWYIYIFSCFGVVFFCISIKIIGFRIRAVQCPYHMIPTLKILLNFNAGINKYVPSSPKNVIDIEVLTINRAKFHVIMSNTLLPLVS